MGFGNGDAHITVTTPFEQLGPHRLNHRKLLLTTVHEKDDFSESNTRLGRTYPSARNGSRTFDLLVTSPDSLKLC